jgi:hypothetical protein
VGGHIPSLLNFGDWVVHTTTMHTTACADAWDGIEVWEEMHDVCNFNGGDASIVRVSCCQCLLRGELRVGNELR